MVCRQSRLGSAMATLARGNSGLEDNQCLSLMHALMREGASTPPPSSTEWNAFIDEITTGVRSGEITVPPRTRGLLERLEAARSETPTGARFYSVQRILRRSMFASRSHEEWLANQARQRGTTVQAIREEFDRHFDAASSDSSVRPSRSFRTSFLTEPATAACLTDNRSLYAYEQIQSATATATATRPSRTVVQRQPVSSTAIAEIGYDPATGRCEVVMRSNSSRVYAYRMSQAEFDAFMSAPSVGSYFARNIRGNPEYQYSSVSEMESSGTQIQCATCGQFADSAHQCPPFGSEEAVNRDLRQAAQRQQPSRNATPEIARMPRTRGQRLYDSESSMILRTATFSRIQQEARRVTTVLAPVVASGTDQETGRPYDLTGQVSVTYLGHGRGYGVEAVTSPGDSRQDNLRCSCPVYRSQYRCPHIDQTVASISSRLNGGGQPNPAAVAAARARVTANLTDEYNASVVATQNAEEGWVPVPTSLMENPAAFQGIYDEYRAARTAYREAQALGDDVPYPIPYATEGALGGLATRESGRGFGTEIEFSFPAGTSDADRREALKQIGKELYDAGLTRSRSQKRYGDSHGWTRDYHQRGWAFEEDPSTGGWGGTDPIVGGEIIAPIMYDEPEAWENISKVCEILKRNGAVSSKMAGLHVHVSVGDYDHRVENHNRLLASVAENEDLLYRMSSNPERGTHRGRYYCAPNRIPTTPYQTVSSASNSHMGHSLAVNMQSVRGRDSDHVEFRTFDSSLEPAVIQAHIAMSVYMAEGAIRPSATSLSDTPRHPLGERHAANPRRANLEGEQWQEATAPIRSFIDRFVPGKNGAPESNPQVRQMVALFAMTRWQSAQRR